MAAHDPLSALTSAAEGDVAAAHACACQLLAGVGSKGAGRDARLLLTAICLRLHSHGGAPLTAKDLIRFLGGQSVKAILAALRDAPLSLTEYAVIELGALSPAQQSVAVSLALDAAERFQAVR